MRAYTFEMKGLVMGATIVVVAKSFEEAQKIANDHATYDDVPQCDNPKGTVLTKPGVLYFHNGDM